MTLPAGLSVGSYEVVGAIGAGGMGEVYRARDTRLKRDVALKVLPAAVAGDPERLTRFHREAEVLASLNHPHIAQIYGIEESNGTSALVMELVEGEDLSQRIARGPLPLEDALPIARQIAEALEVAHDAGIVHRDLKPANIKLRPDGTVKVLDFGLAKALEPAHAGRRDLANSPTMASPADLTRGIILGTAAYMAPEQAKGKPVDRRADIWAFGCVVYEMLTGRKAFDGEDITDTIVAVMSRQPDWAVLPTTFPPQLLAVMRRCLEKDPQRRVPHMSVVRFAIDEALSSPAGADPTPPAHARLGRRGRALLLTAALIVAGTALVSSLWWAGPTDASTSSAVYRATLLIPQNLNARAPSNRFALSPDGRRLAYVAAEGGPVPRVWVRSLDGLMAQALPGTDHASGLFWSPDSRFLAFVASRELKKIDVTGGPPTTIADGLLTLGQSYGGSWNDDDVIVFPSGETLSRVSARGGVPEVITTLDTAQNETLHRFPHFLPDGRHFLYVAYNGAQPTGTYVAALDRADRVRLPMDGAHAQFAAGALVFLRGTSVMAQPFDVSRRELSGQPVPLAELIMANLIGARAGAFSVSRTGALVYQAGAVYASEYGARLVWSTRSGERSVIDEQPAVYRDVSLAPDGLRAILSPLDERGRSDLWLLNVARGLRSRLTFDGSAQAAVWSPDGREVIFSASRAGTANLYRKRAEGGSDEQLVFADDREKTPVSWSPDGRAVLYQTVDEIWVLALGGSREPRKLVDTPFSEQWPQFSPDGRWIAYTSDQSGRREVYVTSAEGGGSWQISHAGGSLPRWSRKSPELFFHSADNKIVAAHLDATGDAIEVTSLTPLFDAHAPEGFGRYFYDVAPDGRFLLSVPPSTAPHAQLTLVLNWPALTSR